MCRESEKLSDAALVEIERLAKAAIEWELAGPDALTDLPDPSEQFEDAIGPGLILSLIEEVKAARYDLLEALTGVNET